MICFKSLVKGAIPFVKTFKWDNVHTYGLWGCKTARGQSFYLKFSQYTVILAYFFRSLHCGRITMHKNLFMSMSLNNMIWIIWYSCVLFQPEVWSTNPTWCRVLHVTVQYFMITTYSWMLCEGAYLQLLLMNTWGVKRWQLWTLIGKKIQKSKLLFEPPCLSVHLYVCV